MKKNITSVGAYLAQLEAQENASNFSSNEMSETFSSNEISAQMSGDDYLNVVDEDSNMSAGANNRIAKPYVLNIVNSTASTATAIIFGFNDYFNQTNFGSDTAITVSSGISGVPYRRMLAQTNNKPFEVGTWRLTCTNTSQLAQSMTISYVDANGRSATDPVPFAIYKDAYQQDNTILDVNTYPFKIDANTYLTIPILGSATLVMILFPAGIADQARTLVQNTSAVDKSFARPRLSGRNTGTRITLVGAKQAPH